MQARTHAQCRPVMVKEEILLYTWSDFQCVDWLNSFTLKSAYLLFKIISKPKLKFYFAFIFNDHIILVFLINYDIWDLNVIKFPLLE